MGEVRTQKPSSDSASGVETKWFTVLWVPETAPRQGPSLGLPVVFTASRVVSIPQGLGSAGLEGNWVLPRESPA